MRKLQAMILAIIFILVSTLTAFGDDKAATATTSSDTVESGQTDLFDGTQSKWAEEELTEAFENLLLHETVMHDYGRDITREEFCTLALGIYEKLTGTAAETAENPFEDTDNQEVLKAYKLGIVKGVGEHRFAPSRHITRQEICVMIFRTIKAARYRTAVDDMADFPYTDEDSIAAWALNEVRFCHQNSIMNGTTPTTMSPLMKTTREQAIVLANRAYESFRYK